MNRRSMLQWSSIYVAGIPVLPSIGVKLAYSEQWRNWLATLIQHCHIEGANELFYPVSLPQADLAGFSSATGKYYFYNQHQYCFTVLEKRLEGIGLLELVLPVWHLQSDGNWQKVTSLSLFQLEALAKASIELAKTANEGAEQYLLPAALAPTVSMGYTTANGTVHVQSRVQTAGVVTAIQVESKQSVIWQATFESAHCLTCQS